MKKPLIEKLALPLLAAVAVVVASQAHATEFDAQSGKPVALYDKTILTSGRVDCWLNAVPYPENAEWRNAFTIILYSEPSYQATQLVYSPENGRNQFDVMTVKEPGSYETHSELMNVENKMGNAAVRATVEWQKSGLISFHVSDDQNQQASGQLQNTAAPHNKIAVIVAGMKGDLQCDLKFPGD